MPSMHLGRMVWQQGQSQAFPEFRTNRMCMRWEDFDDMVTSIQLPEEVSYINLLFFYSFFSFFSFFYIYFLLTTKGEFPQLLF